MNWHLAPEASDSCVEALANSALLAAATPLFAITSSAICFVLAYSEVTNDKAPMARYMTGD
jgi:hypothetical protein